MNFNLAKVKNPQPNSQKGQTLIETLVAIFILVMGVSAALGLAVYAFNSSTDITKEIIGTGLAREGMESIKNMRDTNWLRDTLANCYDYADAQNDAECYLNWLGDSSNSITPYCLNPTTTGGAVCSGNVTKQVYNLGTNYAADYNNLSNLASGNSFWQLNPNPNGFGLNLDSTNSGDNGFYVPSGSTGSTSGYYREITIATNTNVPFNQNVGPELKVSVQVWWTDKKCPQTSSWPGLGNCSIEIDSNLTNWKNY